MKKSFLIILRNVLLLMISNFLIVMLHLVLFKSSIPWLGWASVTLHLWILTYVPYKKMFN